LLEPHVTAQPQECCAFRVSFPCHCLASPGLVAVCILVAVCMMVTGRPMSAAAGAHSKQQTGRPTRGSGRPMPHMVGVAAACCDVLRLPGQVVLRVVSNHACHAVVCLGRRCVGLVPYMHMSSGRLPASCCAGEGQWTFADGLSHYRGTYRAGKRVEGQLAMYDAASKPAHTYTGRCASGRAQPFLLPAHWVAPRCRTCAGLQKW
jgi:hypothetical protein